LFATIDDRSFAVAVPHTWNKLPEETAIAFSFQATFKKLTIFNSCFREMTTSYCEVLLKWLVTALSKLSKVRTCIHTYMCINIQVSLGTSDTVLMWLKQPKVSMEGAVLVNPLDTNHYMGLLW